MAPNKFDEEALRKKIREQLEEEHKERQQQKKADDSAAAEEEPQLPEEDESFYLETYLRRKLEEEVYSRYPDFVKCGNHLGQVKWLTPLEMEEEYEFYPFEENFFSRLRKKLFPTRAKIPKNPEIQKLIREFREDIEADAKERVERYRESVKANKQNLQSEAEKRIFEEEQDRFYRGQKGYYKYRNHTGETRWMTREEFDTQDEFVERAYTKSEIWLRRTVAAVSLIAVVALAYYLYNLLGPEQPKGYIIVDVEGGRGTLYINEALAVGFTQGQPYPVDEGEHRVAVLRSGYISNPAYKDIEVNENDTLRLSYDLKPMAGERAVLQINAPFEDVGIYVDGNFKGTVGENRLLNLAPGDYAVTLEKAGYISVPPVRAVIVTAGDTVEAAFRMNARRSAASGPSNATRVGLIEVNSNVRGADIYINGEKTGFQTDHVLQKLPFGQYVIRLEKEGYDIYPREKVVRLSSSDRQAKADFTLTSLTRPVTISTYPVDGTIYVDGKEVGSGRFSGSLALGSHTVTFGDVEDFIKPGAQQIEVTEKGSTIFSFTYGSKLFLEITPNSIVPEAAAAVVVEGHIFSGADFKSSSQNGPDKTESGWIMGYAFQYRNPPGADAIMIRFKAPEKLSLTSRVQLKLQIYKTSEKYPLVLSGKARYRVILNNSVIADNREPRYTVQEASENRFDSYTITRNLNPGYNTLIIAVSPGNSAFIELRRIVVE